MQIPTFTQLVHDAFGFTTVTEPPVACPAGTYCSLTGESIAVGYPIADIVSEAQGEWWETFNGNPYGYLSVSAANCWRATNPKGENRLSKSLAVFGGVAYEPMISEQSALANSRISWRQLIRDAWEHHRDEPCALVISTDTKKRVWQRARAGILGDRTPFLIYDMEVGVYECRVINWQELIDDTAFVEQLYDVGFNRYAVSTTLLNALPVCEQMGWAESMSAENRLSMLRRRPHWPIVSLIARGLDKNNQRS